ncbi:DNA polymerase III subunit alpha [Paenibacillus agricola]|uniref:DNA polymerase III subunit alpha n=1 Tax=Paenibacillus agricola TaxID=2716264 RepID=A0ABX0J601_9BACL|nr:DNA polymerase III subunit alpha [Paenibacillus agricola]NHN31562.1 DNA polymerase III subunit alpha [Paenibacillus agricola]
MSGFVHLHVHSEYSLLDGAARINDLVGQAAALGMKSLALTDHGVMYGAIPFYKACKQHGINPIIGCEVYYTAGSLRDKGTRKEQPIYHLILLAKNQVGYQNLMKLCSIGHLQGHHYKPRIDPLHLAQYSEGLICTSSCLGSEVSQHLLNDRYEQAKEAALRYQAIFGEDFFLELQDHGLMEQKKVMQSMLKLSEDTGIPLIATNDVHYVREPDHVMQDILICIGTGKTVEDKDRLRMQSSQLYLKSAEEMNRLFPHVPQAILNTLVVAERCKLEIEFGRSILPQFEPIPANMTAGSYLAELCTQGLRMRYKDTDSWNDPSYRKEVEERLVYELSVIERMGFSDYFLIVWDFIRFAHEKNIVTGPGRGSSAGSLVAYVLRITDVDPIRYRLLFERFLNPERVSMPDIDIDFSDLRRDEVIEYVVAKYGTAHVAQIITFGTMAAKAAIRDVGRVLNLPYSEVDRAAKMIPHQLGMTLAEAVEQNPDLKSLVAKQPKTAELLELAMKVEGMPRHASTHAAGVVISREPLTQYVPLQEGNEQTALTQYSMEHLEAIGLLKMDFLGLRTLSIIERTLLWIKEQTGRTIDFHKIDMDDPHTYELLKRGDTTGVFQLESPGMRRVLRDLRPSEFEDIISVGALYRPGPMEFIPRFIQGKHGEIEVEYPHLELEPILRDTYGIIVYQEQIMQIASKMAGFSLGEADLLRRAVSKKKREVLDEERAHFVKGSLSLNYSEAEANKVYDMIVRFADYGFPRAHATAYGVLAFQTAYLKAHYPVQFMASMLTAVMGNHNKVAEYVDECRRMGIAVLPPDVNESGVVFTPAVQPAEAGDAAKAAGVADPFEAVNAQEEGAAIEGTLAEDASRDAIGPEGVTIANTYLDPSQSQTASLNFNAIRFGLAAIKNVGTHAIESIMQVRRSTEGPFESLIDLCRRVDLRVCNKRVLESLIQGGATGSLPGHRAQQLAMLEDTINAALKWRKERDDLQLHLFGFVEDVNWDVEYPQITPYTMTQQLEHERELLGLYISGSPLDDYEEVLRKLDIDLLHFLPEMPDHSEVMAAGLVLSNKTIVTKNGKPMAFMELEDRVSKVEVVLFPEVWKQYAPLVQKGNPILIKAKLQQGDEEVKLLAEQVYALNDPNLLQNAARRLPAASRGGAAAKASSPASRSTGGRSAAGNAGERSTAGSVGGPNTTGENKAGERSMARSLSERSAAASTGQRSAGGSLSEHSVAGSAGGLSAAGGSGKRNDSARSAAEHSPARPTEAQGNQLASTPSRSTVGKAEVPATDRSQRVYIKISPLHEKPDILTSLKQLLVQHEGPLSVLLYYEKSQKMLSLNDQFKVKPSEKLIQAIEGLLGKDTAKVK